LKTHDTGSLVATMIGFHARVILVLAMLAVAGCERSNPPAPSMTRPSHTALTPQDIPGVQNFAQVSPILFRGAQPTEEGFAELKKRGVKTVVSLRTFNSDRSELEGHGLGYLRIYAQAWNVEEQDLVKFLKVLSDPANQPVFVHCQQGKDRTGCAVAVYRMVEQGWTADEAIAEIHNFGYHPVLGEIGCIQNSVANLAITPPVVGGADPRIPSKSC
jgi:tyrosine-protein phosphatase SIW14